MRKLLGLSGRTWTIIWMVAILVTLVGGTWTVPTSQPPDWKFNIQVPGSIVVLYVGWFVGRFQTLMSPPVMCILTILTNVSVYYILVKVFFSFRRKLGADNGGPRARQNTGA